MIVGKIAAGIVARSDDEAVSILVVITPCEVVSELFNIATTLDEAEAIAPSTVVKRAPKVEASSLTIDDDAVLVLLLIAV